MSPSAALPPPPLPPSPPSRVCRGAAVVKKEYMLIGVSADGFASLLDVETGVVNASLPLPPPAHLRRGTPEETAAYEALVRGTRGLGSS